VNSSNSEELSLWSLAYEDRVDEHRLPLFDSWDMMVMGAVNGMLSSASELPFRVNRALFDSNTGRFALIFTL